MNNERTVNINGLSPRGQQMAWAKRFGRAHRIPSCAARRGAARRSSTVVGEIGGAVHSIGVQMAASALQD